MAEADVDSDGVMELAADFTGFGLYIWDSSAWTRINSAEPDMMTSGTTTALP